MQSVSRIEAERQLARAREAGATAGSQSLEEAFPSKRYHPFQLMPKKANVNSGFQSQAASRGSIVSRHRSSRPSRTISPLSLAGIHTHFSLVLSLRPAPSRSRAFPRSERQIVGLERVHCYETSFCFWTAFGNGQQPDQGLRRTQLTYHNLN